MKKLLFALLALSSLTFVACEDKGGDEPEPTVYTLLIEPANATVGEDIIFTVIGDGASNYQLNICDSNTENCFTPFTSGTNTWTVTAGSSPFFVGEYMCHAQLTNLETGDLDYVTEDVKLTVSE